MASFPTRTVGTPGKGNRDAKGAPHKAQESPSRLRASRRYKSKGALQKAASTRARSRSLPPRRARDDTAGKVALERAPTHPLRFCARIVPQEQLMERNVHDILNLYNPHDPLDHAWTIPSPWYFDQAIARLEQDNVFATTWQVVGRVDQVQKKGEFFTADIGGEPIVVVRGEDNELRAFYNVCRHHAAAVVTEAQGCAKQFRCPYHGWTYGIDGPLKGMVEFEGVCNFDRAKNGLVPVKVDTWENFVFVNLDGKALPLKDFLGAIPGIVAPLQLAKKLKYFDRRVYTLNCNWKVYVDNYLDGGYHVPHAHKGLSSVIEYTKYTIENFERACLQSSPLSSHSKSESGVASARQGRAFYLWIYPNFMINAYEGVMDTNLVLPM